MRTFRIYKFQDDVDFNSAYIISHDQHRAGKLMRELTTLRVHFVDHQPLTDFARAQEHFDKNGEGIWINHILPF